LFQKCLSEALKEYESVSVINWMGDYDVRYDNTGLTEISSKKFFEDLLLMVRRGIDRKRTYSQSSSSSASSVPDPSLSSTPKSSKMVPSTSITRDME
jgi:hypothetical protein